VKVALTYILALAMGVSAAGAAGELAVKRVAQEVTPIGTADGGSMQCSFIRYAAQQQWANIDCLFDCAACATVGASSVEDLRIPLEFYSAAASRAHGGPLISETTVPAPLTRRQVVREIDAGRPVMVGINPNRVELSALPEHEAVISGYGRRGRDLVLRVDDPWDWLAGDDPYVRAGGKIVSRGVYDIPYGKFLHGLRWQISTMVRKKEAIHGK
jgi:hypothetical protein